MNVSLVVKAPKDDKVVSRYEKKQSSYIYPTTLSPRWSVSPSERLPLSFCVYLLDCYFWVLWKRNRCGPGHACFNNYVAKWFHCFL